MYFMKSVMYHYHGVGEVYLSEWFHRKLPNPIQVGIEAFISWVSTPLLVKPLKVVSPIQMTKN